MAVNLRPRHIGQELLREDNQEYADVAGNNDHVETESSNGNNSDYSRKESEEFDSDLENESLEARLLQSRARGRPHSKMYGKDGTTVWLTKRSTRTSGM